MKTLLHIDSSPRAGRSHSRQLTATFAESWRRANPAGNVIYRELGLTPVPLVSEDWIAAAFSNPADHTPTQRAAIAVSNEMVDELLAADEVVIGAPIYNFSVTASLKAWIDQIVRVGRTVKYPSCTGVVKGRKVILTTRGGAGLGPGEPMAQLDAQVPYLKQTLGFIGISDTSVVYAGGLGGSDEMRQNSMNKARAEVTGMNDGILGIINDLRSQQFFHGTRADLKPGDLIEPGNLPDVDEQDGTTICVYLTPNLDAAIWGAELAFGEGPSRVYIVEPIGQIEDTSNLIDQKRPRHPFMSWSSREPLRVKGEVTEWPLYHGTRGELKLGDLIKPGHTPNFGKKDRTTTYVYLTRTLDAAMWGAELALGEGLGRIYIVEPTGPIEDDPNLTNKKFRGNPTKSYRSREPLRIVGEITNRQGHSFEAIQAMKDSLERLKRLGVEPIDD